MMPDPGALYVEYHPKLAAYFRLRWGAGAEDADDLASEVLTRALRSLGRYEQRSIRVSVWLYRIAHNLMIDTLRRRGLVTWMSLDRLAEIDRAPGCSFRFDEIGGQEHFDELVALVSPRQRAVLIAHFVEGREYQEMGEISTLQGAKALGHRAFVRLRKALASGAA